MKFKTITCFMLCVILSACSSSVQQGRRDAVRDFNNGIMQLETYGLRSHPDPYEISLAKMGITMKTVAGCNVNDNIIDHAKGYNLKMKELINKKMKKIIFKETSLLNTANTH